MLIGVPREIKKQENRVGLTPGLDFTHPEEAILP